MQHFSLYSIPAVVWSPDYQELPKHENLTQQSESIPDCLICYHRSVSSLFSNDETRQLIPKELICSFWINYCFLLISSSSSWFSALAILFEEYVREINTPGAVPIVQNAWDVVTENKCTEFLENAKAVYK